ncbi:MAG: hypothetical protein ABR562_04590 [Thermoplasmatota archaeon]|nr:hypothetical protein [Halobacteriales archaeon]
MFLYELIRKETKGEADFPVVGIQARLAVSVDFGALDVPPKARRRLAAQALRDILANMDEEELVAANPSQFLTPEPPVSIPDVTPRRHDQWLQPNGLDLRIVKSAHRIIAEVAEKGVSGRVVLASELVGSIGLSAPTIGRLLRDGESANDYLKQFVTITPTGRTKALDLTPAGRLLASKIRAGSVPV